MSSLDNNSPYGFSSPSQFGGFSSQQQPPQQSPPTIQQTDRPSYISQQVPGTTSVIEKRDDGRDYLNKRVADRYFYVPPCTLSSSSDRSSGGLAGPRGTSTRPRHHYTSACTNNGDVNGARNLLAAAKSRMLNIEHMMLTHTVDPKYFPKTSQANEIYSMDTYQGGPSILDGADISKAYWSSTSYHSDNYNHDVNFLK